MMSLYSSSGYGLTERNCAGERRMKKQYLWGRKWRSECLFLQHTWLQKIEESLKVT